MKVLVTGATGFVGSHTAAALTRAGHHVRILARDPNRVPGVLSPHGIDPEVAPGDMTDPDAVKRALDGCDAVIHAAAQVGVGGGGTADDANVRGVRTVIGSAIEAGVERIVYTSSVAVHVPLDEPLITVDSPLAEPMSPYAASKVESERLVRAWQADGHPVSTAVLGGVYGPVAPSLVSSFTPILAAVETMMLVPPGGTCVIDVRDVASLLTRMVEAADAPPRVLAGGHFVTWAEWVDALAEAAGRPIVNQVVTEEEMLDFGRQMEASVPEGEDALITEEAAIVMTRWAPHDDRSSLARFGIELTPLTQTFADTLAYLREIGRLPAEI
ncbi:MAG: NAD-dependent epimerase/dehydratase family protein [Acidimicrobiales bacterium]|nr:NAD-dependent epimerase/dehydratase family protein [Acidimicrobiales bacterium]